MAAGETTVMVQRWLDVLPDADTEAGRQAREELIEHGKRRMEVLCRKMFFGSLQGKVVDWEDVYQEAALRLWKSLDSVKPTTVKEFFGLAARQIQRVLVDLCRKFTKEPPPEAGPWQTSFDPANLAMWTEFHQRVQALPEKLLEVVDLLWYHELSQEEAAEVLGIDKSTVKRRWRAAKLGLADVLRPAPAN